MTVRFHAAARAELREAQAWSEERSPLSAAAFAQEVARGIDRIAEAPTRYTAAEHGTRRFVVERFPFNIFYLAGATEIAIVAVAHQKRRLGTGEVDRRSLTALAAGKRAVSSPSSSALSLASRRLPRLRPRVVCP